MSLLLDLFAYMIPLLLLSWLLPKKLALISQILICAFFIFQISIYSLCILVLITFGNYFLLHVIKLNFRIKITISLVLLITTILTFKFLLTQSKNWIIPLGLSYYIFKNIHYTIEFYKGKISNPRILYYIAYNFFLPTFLIGPINRYQNFIMDWERRRFNSDYTSLGLERILYGVSKIVILGNYFLTTKFLLLIKLMPDDYLWLKTYLESLRFVLNAYVQFAGYSDIAIGFSLILGFRIMENFNSPFMAISIRDFWNRYHISLTTFCRDYIFTTFSSYYRKPFIGILVSMLVLAFWHELSLKYLLWGVVQSLGIYFSFLFSTSSESKIIINVQRFIVLNFFALSCVLISQNNLSDALNLYKILFFIGN